MARNTTTPLSPAALLAVQRLGKAVQQARVRRRLTQAQLAKRAALGVATLQRLERGDTGIALGSFLEVLVVLERDWVSTVTQTIERDDPGRILETSRLPSRVVNSDTF